MALLIIIGSLPIIIIGFFLYTSNLIYYFRNIEIIAWTTLLFGILLYFADNYKITKKFNENLSIKNILIIGLFQILALIPGVSRSGIVITAGRFLNFSRYDSSKISFFNKTTDFFWAVKPFFIYSFVPSIGSITQV